MHARAQHVVVIAIKVKAPSAVMKASVRCSSIHFIHVVGSEMEYGFFSCISKELSPGVFTVRRLAPTVSDILTVP